MWKVRCSLTILPPERADVSGPALCKWFGMLAYVGREIVWVHIKKLSCRRKGTVRKVCFDISEYGINLIHRGVIQNHTVLEQIDHLAGNQRKKTV